MVPRGGRELMGGARRHRRQRREAILPGTQAPRLIELSLAAAERACDPPKKVDNEAGGDPERNPDTLLNQSDALVGVEMIERQRPIVDDRQEAEGEERQGDEHPRPLGVKGDGGERNVDQVKGGKRIEGPAGKIEKRGQKSDIEAHHRGQVPLVDLRTALKPKRADDIG